MNFIKKHYKYLLPLGLFLISFSAFAISMENNNQTFFEMITIDLFDNVIESFHMTPGKLLPFQELLLGFCFLWELFHIYMEVAAGTNSLNRTFEFIMYIIVCFCFMGILSYRQFTGSFLEGNGGKYQGMFLDIDLYNYVNTKAKEVAGSFDANKQAIKDMDTLNESLTVVQEYCSYQSDKADCLEKALILISPHRDGYIDTKQLDGIKHYIAVHDGCVKDDGSLENTPTGSGEKKSNWQSIKDGIVDKLPFSEATADIKCFKNKVSKITDKFSNLGKSAGSWMVSIANVLINFFVQAMINLILLGNVIELVFMMIFSRFIYPFFLIKSQRDNVKTFVKSFIAFAIIPLLMKIGFWVTDSLLTAIVGTFFSHPLLFIQKFFASPVTGATNSSEVTGAVVTTGTAVVAGGAHVAALATTAATAASGAVAAAGASAGVPVGVIIAILAIGVLLVAVGALKIAILWRLSKLSRDLFALNFNALYGVGKDAFKSFGALSGMIMGTVVTGGAMMMAGGSALMAKTGLGSMMGLGRAPVGNPGSSGGVPSTSVPVPSQNDVDFQSDKDDVTQVRVTNPIKTEESKTYNESRPAIQPQALSNFAKDQAKEKLLESRRFRNIAQNASMSGENDSFDHENMVEQSFEVIQRSNNKESRGAEVKPRELKIDDGVGGQKIIKMERRNNNQTSNNPTIITQSFTKPAENNQNSSVDDTIMAMKNPLKVPDITKKANKVTENTNTRTANGNIMNTGDSLDPKSEREDLDKTRTVITNTDDTRNNRNDRERAEDTRTVIGDDIIKNVADRFIKALLDGLANNGPTANSGRAEEESSKLKEETLSEESEDKLVSLEQSKKQAEKDIKKIESDRADKEKESKEAQAVSTKSDEKKTFWERYKDNRDVLDADEDHPVNKITKQMSGFFEGVSKVLTGDLTEEAILNSPTSFANERLQVNDPEEIARKRAKKAQYLLGTKDDNLKKNGVTSTDDYLKALRISQDMSMSGNSSERKKAEIISEYLKENFNKNGKKDRELIKNFENELEIDERLEVLREVIKEIEKKTEEITRRNQAQDDTKNK